MRIRIVTDERHNDAGVSELLLDVAEIGRVGEFDARDGLRVLILRLDENDWAAIRDLSFRDDLAHTACIAGNS